MVDLITKYINIVGPLRRQRPGLSESVVRKHFQKAGCLTWRGSYLDFSESEWYAEYPNVIKHYELLENIFNRLLGSSILTLLKTYCKINHGTPDFVIYERNTDKLFFVEAKLDNESLSERQLTTINFIAGTVGIPTYVYRVHTTSRLHKKAFAMRSYQKDRLKGIKRRKTYYTIKLEETKALSAYF